MIGVITIHLELVMKMHHIVDKIEKRDRINSEIVFERGHDELHGHTLSRSIISVINEFDSMQLFSNQLVGRRPHITTSSHHHIL
jgi:hypothetical protein